MFNPMVSDTSSTNPSSQPPENKEVTNIKKNCNASENPELVSGLFLESGNDPDLKLLMQCWPNFSNPIKAAIKALIQTYIKEVK